ncbi:hypothetical protein PCANC_06304 [Puccinia coronata f. sp. avenae]|uniref:Uncharacterized protein n=1 Tax=Puccinia coronata f. sp. avenae TaxID=200324 RepID=A0A2N5VRQ8_9BASI|nr:hypothetical protein PCANC_06304 [Puccinia coronata f. sp. avenae]
MPSATPVIDPALSFKSNELVIAPSSKNDSGIAASQKKKPRRSLKQKSPAKNSSKSAIPKDIDSESEEKKSKEVKLDDNSNSESDSDKDKNKKSSRARNYNGTEDKQFTTPNRFQTPVKPPLFFLSKPTDRESDTALPLPSKTRRSRHKYSSRSWPSIDRPLPVPLYSPLSAILRLAALGLNPIPSQPLVY